ncbi:MAG: CHAT domain-containing protein [Aureispira sp.]
MKEILALIDEVQIYDAIDELDDLGIDTPEYEQLKEEYDNGAKSDFLARFKKFVIELDQKETAPVVPPPSIIDDKNVNKVTGANNITFQGINTSQIDLSSGGSEKKKTAKILFMGANPKNAQSLDLNKEYRTLQQEMRQGSQRDRFEWLLPVFAATLPEMMRGLNQEPQIIHFSGHGLNKGLVLEDEKAYAQVITNEMLELLFKDLQGIVKIIFLNSCYSGAQAKFLSQLGCHVIGYNTPVGDVIAQSFAKGFYLGLSDGKGFMAAVNAGRVMVMGEHPKGQLPLEVWKEGELVVL